MITSHIYQVPNVKESIFKFKPDIRCSKYISLPMPVYGYFYFLNKNRLKLNILKTENFKNKTFYNIVNPYELTIPDYNKSIGDMTKEYFNIRGEIIPNINNNEFYKLWEILFMFDLITDKTQSLHLEDSGEALRSIMFYKDKFNSTKLDKFFIQNNKQLNNNLIKFYKNDRINIVDKIEGEYNLITATSSLIDDIYAEQESYEIILNEIINALKHQSKGGNFICKFFDFMTTITIKYLVILQEVYQNVLLIKPLMSRKQDIEIYVVCINYKGIDKNNLNKLENLLLELQKCKKNNFYLNDIFIEFPLPIEIENFITYTNTKINNDQFIFISNMMIYINSGNYFGEKYHEYRQKQIQAQDIWLPLFFPLTQKDFKQNKDSINTEISKIIINNKKDLIDFMK
jgi:hypothetical protein